MRKPTAAETGFTDARPDATRAAAERVAGDVAAAATNDAQRIAAAAELEPTLYDIMGRALVAMQAQLDLFAVVFSVMRLQQDGEQSAARELLRRLGESSQTGAARTMPATFGSGTDHNRPERA